MNPRLFRIAAPLLCILAAFLAYSNSMSNTFELDDWHTIQDNPSIRSLDGPHLRRFFTDVNAFSVLPRNIDYRPALLVTYAINYAWSDRLGAGDITTAAYSTRTWHWLNTALHALSAIGLFFTARALIGPRGLSTIDAIPSHPGGPADLLCLIAALAFVIHPMNSGAVNYISARSSVMVAALLLPALALYLNVLAGLLRAGWLAAAAVLYAVATLTKVEAVAFIAVLAAAEVLLAPALQGLPLIRRLPQPAAFLRLTPFAILTIAYLALWRHMSTLASNAGKASADMTPGVYFLTQVRAWWYYVGEFVAPVRLVFDEAAYPISGAVSDSSELAKGEPLYTVHRALLDPRVWFAIVGWLFAAAASLRLLRRAPLVAFILACYLIFLSPSSSFVPLAEMVNDHRPYLPTSGLYILAVCGLWLLLRAFTPRPGAAFALVALGLAVPYVGMTMHRNAVFRDDLSLYADTAAKSPDSARAQMNYGLALMRHFRNADAEARFRRSISVAPYWHYPHTNLAIVLAAQAKYSAAVTEHDEAVRCGSTEPGPYYWRGRFRAGRGDVPGALADFQAAVDRNPSAFKEAAALAAGLARAGKAAEADSIAARYGAVNPRGFAAERASAATLFAKSESSIALNDRAVALMGQSKFEEALDLLTQALRADPSNHLAQSNIGVIRAAQGDDAGALAAHNEAVRLAPDNPSPYYWRARLSLKKNDFSSAIDDLKAAAQRSNQNIHETAPLVECLTRAGRATEAQALIDLARQAGQADAMDKERAAFRAAVFGEH